VNAPSGNHSSPGRADLAHAPASRRQRAYARLINAEGKLFAQATSNCLIVRPGD
jgi:hypothetical protein